MIRQLLIIAALCGSVTAAEEVKLSLGIPGGETVSMQLGWTNQEITGLRLVEWNEDIGGMLSIQGTSGQQRELLLEMHDGRLVVRVDAAGAGPVTPSDPPPVDPPVIPPVVPEGHLGLTRQTHGWVIALVDLAKDPQRTEHAQGQAASYATVAAGLLAVPPKWDSVSAAFEALREANRAVLPDGPVRDAWAAFSLRVSNRIEQLWPFESPEAARILKAIGDGLAEVN